MWVAVGSRERADAAEQVAAVASARREMLLRVHAYRLRREDLEDCYSQATLELIVRARRDGGFTGGTAHLAHALEQRFVSRIQDRRRALSGRSPIQAAMENASALGADDEAGRIEPADARQHVEHTVILRQELRRLRALATMLTPDQRLVLACQVGLEMPPGEFCRRFGWSMEKYRKVGQRARARLRQLMELDEDRVPSTPEASERRQWSRP